MHRILVVDDDPSVTSLSRRSLSYEASSWTPLTRDTRPWPSRTTDRQGCDPRHHDAGLDGLEGLRRLPADAELPVVMLTARDAPTDQVRGLEGGADNHVTRPFSVEVVATRVVL